MKTINRILSFGLAFLGAMMVAGSALAYEATADTALNVRSGPSVDYGWVDSLSPGERVTVVESECRTNGWCYIQHSGANGWVNTSYLTPISGSGGASGPDCRFELVLGGGVPRLRIVCGDGGGGGGGGGPLPGGGGIVVEPNRACFYDGPNFSGTHFCRAVGTYNTLGAGNDRITSVQLHGNVKARLCEDTNMGPYCRDVTASEGQLGPYLNNKASSLRVYTGSLPPLKQACFFSGLNYSGDHECLRVGNYANLGAWNDRVESIAVFGGAKVRVYVNPGYGGASSMVSTNHSSLMAPFNGNISSLRVQP